MTQVPFRISARTAKLIGRENFSNPEGAVIELVKNSYDADAKICMVIFSIKYDSIPMYIPVRQFQSLSKTYKIVSLAYKQRNNRYVLNSSLSQENLDSLREIFFKDNAIYIIDNGHGMTPSVISSQWMEIGTDNKETDYMSKDGRVKTGAKGIGRFALDRLGFTSELWTVPKQKNEAATYWKMDWKQFDLSNASLSDVKADIEDYDSTLKLLLKKELKKTPALVTKLNAFTFEQGTVIKISSVKDNWHSGNLEGVYKSLEALVPPRELAIPFKVFFYYQQNLKEFGEIETAFFNDFDYRIDAKYDAKKLKTEITLTRNELNLKEVKTKYSHLFEEEKFPYDLKTVLNKKFEVPKSIFDLLKWEKNTANATLLRNLGDFDFSFYYMKNTSFQRDYPYRDVNLSERQQILKRFGGIKVYRDSFRVRPYGDIGNDWLKLGERSAMSPAGAGQRIGDWRVGPNQIAGMVKISRIDNPNLVDKSDRGALIENESFTILKRIITEIINYFEIDRSIILNRFYLKSKEEEKKKREQEIQGEAEKLADKIVEERLKVEKNIYGTRADLFRDQKIIQEKKAFQRIIEEGLQNIEKPEEADAEIAQVRTLASLGLIVSSFAHELKEIKNNIDDIDVLEKLYEKIVPEPQKSKQDYLDGIDIIEALRIDNRKIEHWVEYSLTAIKKDKRKRTSIKLDSFFNSLTKQWAKVLSDRNIEITYKNYITKPYLFRAFEMDLSTIFSNLISNSIDALNNLKVVRPRRIQISSKLIKHEIEIQYSDTGTGLPKIFQKEKEQIFLPFTTSKKDKDGNDIGTGLGMYLVKNVVDDNNGSIEIMDSNIGFKIRILFPTRNK